MQEQLQIRIHEVRPHEAETQVCLPEGRQAPTLIYLPGLHGDWTLVGGFRKALAGRARFVEITYPRSLTWSLDDYAAGVESALAGSGVKGGWLLAESYGSQVGWQILKRNQFCAEGIILAGGFVQYPVMLGLRVVSWLARRFSVPLMKPMLRVYAAIFRVRNRRATDVLSQMEEFLNRRTELDLRAATHRLDLIAGNDPSLVARSCRLPVYSLTGLIDPIVPWVPVKKWLARNCPGLRDCRTIWRADHTVLASAPQTAANQILKWVAP